MAKGAGCIPLAPARSSNCKEPVWQLAQGVEITCEDWDRSIIRSSTARHCIADLLLLLKVVPSSWDR